ncbi:MAG: hypothetical protein ACOYMT_05540, partial [Chthoniobacterales bacterium]
MSGSIQWCSKVRFGLPGSRLFNPNSEVERDETCERDEQVIRVQKNRIFGLSAFGFSPFHQS